MEKAKEPQFIEYICTWCGQRAIRGKTAGRPSPGTCPRKPVSSNKKSRPHTWIVNRRI